MYQPLDRSVPGACKAMGDLCFEHEMDVSGAGEIYRVVSEGGAFGETMRMVDYFTDYQKMREHCDQVEQKFERKLIAVQHFTLRGVI